MTFSVIVPVFNAESYVRMCLDSILSQNFVDFEVIVINDGSSDDSPRIIREFQERDGRVIVVNIANSGNCVARNIGLRMASGDYVCFVDSDDFIDTGMLGFYDHIFSKTDCDVVYNTHKRVNNDGYPHESSDLFLIFDLRRLTCFCHDNMDPSFSIYRTNDALDFALEKTLTMLWAGVFKRRFLIDNNIRLMEQRSYEDVIFGMSVFSKNPRICFANEAFYNYRESHNSLSVNSVHDTSRRSVSLNLLRWVNVSLEMEKIYVDSMSNALGRKWELYCKDGLVFCIDSACNELQKYGYLGSTSSDVEHIKSSLHHLSQYMPFRKKMIIRNPLVFGFPKRITKRIKRALDRNQF